VWQQLWGSAGDRLARVAALPEARTLDVDRPQLERLALPETLYNRELDTMPGANLSQLGIATKSKIQK
jgi:hypothetical protein